MLVLLLLLLLLYVISPLICSGSRSSLIQRNSCVYRSISCVLSLPIGPPLVLLSLWLAQLFGCRLCSSTFLFNSIDMAKKSYACVCCYHSMACMQQNQYDSFHIVRVSCVYFIYLYELYDGCVYCMYKYIDAHTDIHHAIRYGLFCSVLFCSSLPLPALLLSAVVLLLLLL